MAMPTRILIKVNLILIQYRTRKGSATGCKDTENFSRMLLVLFKPFSIIILGNWKLGTGDWGLGTGKLGNWGTGDWKKLGEP